MLLLWLLISTMGILSMPSAAGYYKKRYGHSWTKKLVWGKDLRTIHCMILPAAWMLVSFMWPFFVVGYVSWFVIKSYIKLSAVPGEYLGSIVGTRDEYRRLRIESRNIDRELSKVSAEVKRLLK